MRFRMIVLSAIAVVFSLASVHAGEYASPQGFKFTYPEGWTKTAGKQYEVTFSGPESDGGAPTFNVLALKVRMELTEENEKLVVDGAKKSFTARGVTVPEIKTSHVVADGHKLFVMEYDIQGPTEKSSVRVRSIVFPTKNGTCVLTCGAGKSQWAEIEPSYTALADSLKFDAEEK